MNLRQLRCVREIVHYGLSLSAASAVLFTPQPGISKQIRALEEELGIEIFVRKGKRLTTLTGPGAAALSVIERILTQENRLRSIGREFLERDAGTLTVATTHTQARYALPRVVRAFRSRYPQVRLILRQGTPRQAAEAVRDGQADLAVATEALDGHPDLVALPAYSWTHCIVVPHAHPLAGIDALSIEELARHPLITYGPGFTGRSHIDDAFAARGLEMNVVLTAMDADVIKAYAELGLGAGIIAGMAYEPERDEPLVAIDAGHLFGTNTTRVAVLEGRQLPQYAVDFIRELAPALSTDRLHQRKSRPVRASSRQTVGRHPVRRDHGLDGQSRARASSPPPR